MTTKTKTKVTEVAPAAIPRAQAWKYLGLTSLGALERLHAMGEAPPCIKVHRRLTLYRIADLNAWLADRVEQ
jgi:hypothetical protein